jgi:hypothetical protein
MKTFYKQTIIDNIDFEGYEVEEPKELKDKINLIYDIFKNEYGFMCTTIGEYNAFGEWLRGLPSALTVPFYNYDILENAKNAGFFMVTLIDNDGNREQVMADGRTLLRKQEKFLDTYWAELSLAFFNIKDKLCKQN